METQDNTDISSFDDIKKNRGSEWHKWDLHVHTKFTNKNDQFKSETFDDFCKIFFRKALDHDIKAIGITDYFSLDNYKKVIDFIIDLKKDDPFTLDEIELINNIFIFPNIELRMLPTTNRNKLINIHCLFNPKYIRELENDFFGAIENSDRFKMNRHGITSYGYSLQSENVDDVKAYKEGLAKFIIDPLSVNKLLDKKEFKDNTIIIVSNSSSDGNSGYQEHFSLFENEDGSPDGIRSSIYKMSNAIFSTREKDITYFLGKRLDKQINCTDEDKRKERESVIFKRGSLKSCLVGSDAHCENELFNKFTWIKGELSFEGLQQIIYEPEFRVRIQEEEPDLKEKSLIIDEVRFISEDFTPKPIRFNRNLNVIIGGKSSGKSALLYYIAYLLRINNDDNKQLYQTKDDNGKDINIYSFHNKKEKHFDFEIKLLSGASSLLSAKDKSILPYIKYIPQNYLTKLADSDSNKLNNDLNKIVRDLLNEDVEYQNKYNDFLEIVKQKDTERRRIIDDYFGLLDRQSGLKKRLESLGDKVALEASKKSKEKEAEELKIKAKLTPEQNEEYANLTTQLNVIKENIKKSDLDYKRITNFGTYAVGTLKDLVNKYNTEIHNISDPLMTKFDCYFTPIKDALESVKSFHVYLASNEGDEFIKDLVEEQNRQQINISNKLEPFISNKEDQEKIKNLEISILSDKNKLEEIDSVTKEINDLNTSLENKKTDLLNSFTKSYEEYKNIASSFEPRIDNLGTIDLHIKGVPKYNFLKFRSSVVHFIDGRISENWKYEKYPILNQDLSRNNQLFFEDIVKSLSNLFEDTVSDNYVLNSKYDKKDFLEKVFDDYFYDYWEVSYKGDSLGEMSTGKASFVILMLIIGLSKEKGPILIDQPEDNLDNRSISTELVSFLREKKQERQIILVTHNPNVVVNADAENVIVAEQKGQRNIKGTDMQYRFDYINGALENSFVTPQETDVLKRQGIKEHVAEIVEGGEEAFIKRERKYNFQKKKQ